MLIPFPGTPLTKHIEDYDLNWKEAIPEEYFYRGRMGFGKSFVSTSHLEAYEIDEFWKALEKELRREGIET